MEINETAKEIHKNAKAKGWWDNPSPDATQIALFHAELSEALECMRRSEPAEYFVQTLDDGETWQQFDMETHKHLYTNTKTEGWATELIDCVIRIFDFLEHKGIDIEEVMSRKMKFNETRPYKHGKKF